jgi:LysM repeat protein
MMIPAATSTEPAAVDTGTAVTTPVQVALLPTPPATITPAPKLTPEPTPAANTYVVRAGDRVWSIAAQFHVTPKALIAANHLSNPDLVQVGQRLVIPEASPFLNSDSLLGDVPMLAKSDGRGNTVHILSLRTVVEQLGGIVIWEEKTRTVTAEVRGHTVVLTVGSTKAVVDGKPVKLELAPTIVDGGTLVPIRFLAEVCELSVIYEDGVLYLAER